MTKLQHLKLPIWFFVLIEKKNALTYLSHPSISLKKINKIVSVGSKIHSSNKVQQCKEVNTYMKQPDRLYEEKVQYLIYFSLRQHKQ